MGIESGAFFGTLVQMWLTKFVPNSSKLSAKIVQILQQYILPYENWCKFCINMMKKGASIKIKKCLVG